MVEINQFASQQSQGFTEQNQSQQAFNQQNQSQTPKGLFQIPEKWLQLIPWIPVGLEMLTGQRIPPTGILADILQGIQQVQFQVSQVLTQQQRIWNKLESLESNASSQLNNLSQQVASTSHSFKMLATETKRSLEIERKPRPELEPNYQNE